jgi:hypothetical protein
MKTRTRKIIEPVPLRKQARIQSSLDRFIITRSKHNTNTSSTNNNNGACITRSRTGETVAVKKEQSITQVSINIESSNKRQREQPPTEPASKTKVRVLAGQSPVFQNEDTRIGEKETPVIKQESTEKMDTILRTARAMNRTRSRKKRTGMK